MAYSKPERLLSGLIRVVGHHFGDQPGFESLIQAVPGLPYWKDRHHGLIQAELQNEKELADAIAKLNTKERSLLQAHIRSGNNI